MSVAIASQTNLFSTSTRPGSMTKAYPKDHIRRMHVVRGVGWMCVEGACEKKTKDFGEQ